MNTKSEIKHISGKNDKIKPFSCKLAKCKNKCFRYMNVNFVKLKIFYETRVYIIVVKCAEPFRIIKFNRKLDDLRIMFL